GLKMGGRSRARGERLVDRPPLDPGLAEPELQPRPDFGGSGNPRFRRKNAHHRMYISFSATL
ncbi:MAG: hypothetical protein WB384_06475, partial [Candidatus Sulfotelmatobacter sp.]